MFYRLVDGGCKVEINDGDKRMIEKIEEDVFQLVYNETKDGAWVGNLETNKTMDFKVSSKIRKSFYYYERNNKDGVSFFSFK